ncbi:hypothetical protein SHKM778_20450 [Streptomyces sp. KM77-8]|uniref:SCP domain-containing protein n=1 Tax=Streptomyces haneummycinicus TaxID=3074435 RepID=A0AAT9HE91_9ACTN
MGRHRRSADGGAATGRATGGTHDDLYGDGPYPSVDREDGPPTMGTAPYLNPEAYAETYALSEEYLYATADAATPAGGTDFATAAFPQADLTAPIPAPAHGGFPDAGFAQADFSAPAADFSQAGLTASIPAPAQGGFPDAAFPQADFNAPAAGFPQADLTAPIPAPAHGGFPDAGFSARRDRIGPAFPGDGPAADHEGPRPDRHRRRKKKAATPVRTGLLGVSAAMALGTVAVATGAVPGLENYKLGGERTPATACRPVAWRPTRPPSRAAPSAAWRALAVTPAPRRAVAASAPPPGAVRAGLADADPGEEGDRGAGEDPGEEGEHGGSRADRRGGPAPHRRARAGEAKTTTPVAGSAEAVAGVEVLRLVNVERAKVGCSPVTASGELTDLATAFSDDMAQRDFFDHTDPDGDTPWDRAETAGIANLGGENIARGQADAEAVMQAWMDSPGHKANILNCDFKTLGVGVHMGAGGPWWTQNFGY